ncbi:MAG: hypothetical protein ABJK11_01195 [Balneola sp.]
MGHERVGVLPKTKRWVSIVNDISNFSPSAGVQTLASDTLENVKNRFVSIEEDSGVHASFKFLVLLSISSKQENPQQFLKQNGIELPKEFSPLKLAKSLSEWTSRNAESTEYASFAKHSAIDAISKWYLKHNEGQTNLFTSDSDPIETWKKASNGAGFCELSRLYFSNFTERYLKYFLEREASASIESIHERNVFNEQLNNHFELVSKHAFETAKITQSFSAGWFNKYAKTESPSDKEIEKFLSFSFKKMRDELSREND